MTQQRPLLRRTLLGLCCLFVWNLIFANPPLLIDEDLRATQSLIGQKRYQEAIHLLQEIRIKNHHASLDILLGDTYINLGDPLIAFFYYNTAYEKAKVKQDDIMIRIALLRLAKTQVSLNNLAAAKEQYQQVLNQKPLPSEREEALTGLTTIDDIELGEKLTAATTLVEHNYGQSSYELLKDELKTRKSYRLEFLAGQSLAMKNEPKDALTHFQKALALSQTTAQKKSALVGIIKMQNWLDNQAAVQKSLTQLQQLPLSAADKQQLSRFKIPANHQSSNISDTPSTSDTPTIVTIRTLIRQGRAQDAQNLLKHYPNKTSYLYYLSSADTAYLLDKPAYAQAYYQLAYHNATRDDDKKAALFGITKSALWIENYKAALAAYDKLSSLPLSAEDQEIVTAGRITALTNQDYPRKAYAARQQSLHYPVSVIATTKAALAAGWGYKAKAIWQDNQTIVQQIPPKSYLDNQRKNVDWLLRQNTSKGSVDADYYTTKDSDLFKINRESAYASYRLLGTNSNTTVLINNNQYFDPNYLANAKTVFLKQDFLNIADQLNINLTAAATNVGYKEINQASWNPFLWQAGFNYIPNDYWSFFLYNNDGLVETIPALQNKILINTTEASVLAHPHPKIYARLAGFHNIFTDNNNRNGLSAALTYQLISELGLFTELRYRGYRNSNPGDPNYFSPAQLQEGWFVLIFKRRIGQTLYVYADGDIGQQTIVALPSTPSSSRRVLAYNLALEKRLGTRTQLSLNYGYTQDAFNNFLGAYAQTYFGVNLKLFID